MKLILILISAFVLSACSKGGDSAPAAAVDPIYGDWYYAAPGATSTQGTALSGSLKPDGSALLMSLKIYFDGNTTVIYYRKSVGTFERNGEEFKMKYSYETCSAIGEEILRIKALKNDQLGVDIVSQSVQLVMNRVPSSDSQNTVLMIEDKACDKF